MTDHRAGGGMRFVDRTLLRLADPAERAAMFTTTVGERLLAAAYVPTNAAVDAVDAVTVRALALTPLARPARRAHAEIHGPDGGAPWSAVVHLPAQTGDVHATVEVDVATQARGVRSDVVEVAATDLSDLADLDALDARIGTPLPAEPELSERRYDELVAAVGERFTDTDPADVAAALRARGLTDLGALLAWLSPPNRASRLALTVVTDASVPPAAVTYRLRVLVLVVDALDGALAPALTALAGAREDLGEVSDPAPVPAGMSLRHPFPAVLVFPDDGLDDAGLPLPAGPTPNGAAARRAARLTELTTRLRDAGIVPLAQST